LSCVMWDIVLLKIISMSLRAQRSNPEMPPLERLDCHASSRGSQ
jgi:hypothetical protein